MMDKVIRIMTYSMDMFSHNSQKHLQEILDWRTALMRWRDISRRPIYSVLPEMKWYTTDAA